MLTFIIISAVWVSLINLGGMTLNSVVLYKRVLVTDPCFSSIYVVLFILIHVIWSHHNQWLRNEEVKIVQSQVRDQVHDLALILTSPRLASDPQ